MSTGVAGMKLDGDIRMILCMTNTTVDTEQDGINFLDDFTTLDEHDGSGYARLALSGATPSVAIDTARDSVKLTVASNPVFPSLGAGTRDVAGVLFYVDVLADDAQSVPMLWSDYTTPRVADGSNFTIELPSGKVIFEFMQAASGTTPVNF